MDEYNKKQSIIEKQIEVNEVKLNEERIKRKMEIENRKRKLQFTIDKNHQMKNEKVSEILVKINQINDRIVKKQSEQEKELMFKNECNNIKRKNKIKVLTRLSKIQEYQNDINKSKIDEKMRKAEEFKEQKQYFLDQKKKMADNIAKQKSEVLLKFDKMMKNSGTISAEAIRNLFPDDIELYERIVGK